ncbi:hypothetical protein Hanom_Chr00s000007g01615141 [Helianthus anomalus]
MCMVTTLVLNKKYNFSRIVFHYMKDNITSGSKTWVYPRFVQMFLDHAYPNLEKDAHNDLLVLNHMDNETLIRLSKYHKNWPEPKTKTYFFGFIKSANYEDPDPINHLKWRNDEEMKEKSEADELKKLDHFFETRNDGFTKEVKVKKRDRKRTPKVQAEEGSSSQPQKKRKKKAVETMLVDEPEEVETKPNVGDDKEKSSSDEEESDIYVEAERWIKENYDPRDKEKSTSRKHVVSPAVRKLKIKVKPKPASEPQQPHQSTPPQNSPPPQKSPPHQSSPQLRISKPIHEQPVITSPHILQTPPTSEPPGVPTNYSWFLQKKVEEELVEKKKLEDRVKYIESENSSLLKKVKVDQADIDILNVHIAELEEEKARIDEQNEYFKLKNKELEANNAMKEDEA